MSIGAAAAAAASVALLDAAAGAGVPFSFYQTGSIPVNTSETDLVVLNCSGRLPASGYPTDIFRTNFTTLFSFCEMGCICEGDSLTPNCKLPFAGSNVSDFSQFNSSGTCISNCNCISVKAANITISMNVNTSRSSEITNITLPGNVSYPANETTVPLNVTILKDMTSPGQTSYNGTITTVPQNTTNVTCPKGPFPSGTSAKNYRFPYPKVDISCYPQNTPLWTLITPDFDSTNAQLCDQCPENYGPDPDCKLQPIPLPGPCCNPGQGCYFVTKLSKREESVLTTGKRGDKRKAVKRFISAAENVLWPE